MLGADALVGLVRHDDALVAAPGQRREVGAGRPGRARAVSVETGVWARSPTVCRPRRCRTSCVFSPTPHSAPTGSGCRKATTSSAGTTSRPSGLHRADASLATNLLLATPTEQVMPCSSIDGGPDPLADLPRAAEAARRAAHVEERLVERDRLDQRRDRAEHLHDAGGGPAVGVEVGRDDHRLRAHAAGAHHRHGAVDAGLPGLVGRRQHDAAGAAAADDHRACRAARAGSAG